MGVRIPGLIGLLGNEGFEPFGQCFFLLEENLDIAMDDTPIF